MDRKKFTKFVNYAFTHARMIHSKDKIIHYAYILHSTIHIVLHSTIHILLLHSNKCPKEINYDLKKMRRREEFDAT